MGLENYSLFNFEGPGDRPKGGLPKIFFGEKGTPSEVNMGV